MHDEIRMPDGTLAYARRPDGTPTRRFRWVHDGPGAAWSDRDHKARAAEGMITPRCRSCSRPIRAEGF